jgi:glycosyltransferase involved in cell wall biosynthesis
MNILILSPFFPYPPNQGGKIRVFNLIKYLSRRNRVTLACLSSEKVDDYGPLRDYCEEIVCVERPVRTARDLASFLLGRAPFNFVRYSSKEFRSALADLRGRKSFDVVQVEMAMLWQYADSLAGIPVVLDEHNVEYELVRGLRQGCGNALKRALYVLEEKRFRQREEAAWEACRVCFTVSDKEREIVVSRTGNARKVVTVPNGVDLEKFVFRPKTERGRRILFLGGMDWAPNLDSARFFLEEIFPLIRERMPKAEVDFVGKDLWKIRDLVRIDGIRLHENIPEVLPWFQQADVLAVPLRQGAGTRIKILEAMASGLPVVTTTKGCDGTEVVQGKHLLIADSAQDFAGEVLRLIEDDPLAARLAQEARSLVEKKYSWEMAASTIHETLSGLK